MARIATSGTNPTLQKLKNVAAISQNLREQVLEVHLIFDAYATDALLATDLGATAADATTLHNLVTQAFGEMCSTASTQVNVGATTGTRQLTDAVG